MTEDAVSAYDEHDITYDVAGNEIHTFLHETWVDSQELVEEVRAESGDADLTVVRAPSGTVTMVIVFATGEEEEE